MDGSNDGKIRKARDLSVFVSRKRIFVFILDKTLYKLGSLTLKETLKEIFLYLVEK